MKTTNLDEYFHNRILKEHMTLAETMYNQFIECQTEKGVNYVRKLDEIDFHKLAKDFLQTRNPNVADNVTWIKLISTYLSDYIEPRDEYIIPVEWSVYSTVVVKGAKSLAHAKKIVEDNLDDIPLPTECEYIDDSYHIQADTDEDLEMAQDYRTRGVLLDITGGKVTFERL